MIKCLQVILGDKTKTLEEECYSKLTKRMEMFSNAANVSFFNIDIKCTKILFDCLIPLQVLPSDVQDLVGQVYRSPSRNYFMFMFLSIVGLIFMFGLFCGRITRRAIILKNK